MYSQEIGKFDTPVYSDEEILQEKDKFSGIKEQAPKIVAGIVFLTIVFALYWYFVLSLVSSEITILDTEGNLVNAPATIKEGSNQIAAFNGSTTISLRPGTYTIQVTAADYKNTSQTIQVTENQSLYEIVLERNYDMEILGLEFPEKIFEGQTLTTSFNLKNNGKTEEVEIVVEGTEQLSISITPKTIVAEQGITPVTLSITAPQGVRKDSERITLRIKGLLEKETRVVEVLETPDVKITNTSLNFGTIQPGETVQKEMTVRNSERVAVIGDYSFKAEANSVKNNAEEVNTWFSFNPDTLQKIDASSSEKISVIISDIPINAVSETITGTITASTSFWSDSVNFSFNLKEAETQLEVSTTTNVYLTKSGTEYQSKNNNLNLSNTGDLDLTNISISSQDCGSEWISVSDPTISEIQAGQDYQVILTISAPSDTAENTSTICNLNISFDNPKEPGTIAELLPTKIVINT